jgi:hypothetical protein
VRKKISPDERRRGEIDPRSVRRPPQPPGRLSRAILRDLRASGPGFVARKSAASARRAWQLRRYRWHPRVVFGRADAVAIDRPIFLLGLPGGGQTVLARCLYRHRDTVYASGNSDWWAGPDEIQNCSHIHDLPDPLVHRSYHFGNVDASIEHHPRFGYQRAFLFATDEMLPRYRRSADDVDEQTTARFRRVIQKIGLAYAHDPQRFRFVDMSHLYIVQVPYLRRMLSDARPRFVLTARNPYALLTRAVTKDFRLELGSYLQDDLSARIEFAVQHWENCYREAFEAARCDPMLLVRYEDFLADPESVVRKICDFVELDFQPEQVPGPGQEMPLGSLDDGKWYPLLRDQNERYLKVLEPELVATIQARGGDLVERLGYERLS